MERKEGIGLIPKGEVDPETHSLRYRGRTLGRTYLLLPPEIQETNLLKLRPVVVLALKAGWGHLFEAYAVAKSLQERGIPVIVADILDVTQPRNSALIEMFCRLYEKAQRSSLRPEGKGSFPKLPRWAYPKLPGLFNIFERPLRRDLEDFLEAVGASFAITTHPTAAGALARSEEWRDKIINVIPDPFGYAGLMGLAYYARPGIETTTFDKTHQKWLEEVFGVERVSTLKTPIPLSVFDQAVKEREKIITNPGEAKYTRRRWDVMISTGGAGGNWEDIEKVMREMAEELRKKDSRYRLFVFVGNHKHLESRARELAARLEILDSENFEIVASDNLREMSEIKYRLQAQCEITIEKAGEPVLICPWLGTIVLCLGYTSPHERGNLLTGGLRGGLVLPFSRARPALLELNFNRRFLEELFGIRRNDQGEVINPSEVNENLQHLAPISVERKKQMEEFVRKIIARRG